MCCCPHHAVDYFQLQFILTEFLSNKIIFTSKAPVYVKKVKNYLLLTNKNFFSGEKQIKKNKIFLLIYIKYFFFYLFMKINHIYNIDDLYIEFFKSIAHY